jgi:hypothetical protein
VPKFSGGPLSKFAVPTKLTVLGPEARETHVGEAGGVAIRIIKTCNIVFLLSLALDVHTASFSLCHPKKTKKKDGVDPGKIMVEDLPYMNEVRWWGWTN